MSSKQRWFIVSNRLPFQYDSKAKTLKESSGGLVTAIKGIKSEHPITWIGSLTEEVNENMVHELNKSNKKIQYAPIYIDSSLYDTYYNKLCNDVFWPLFHYETELVKFSAEAWDAYEEVNTIFAEKIISLVDDGDVIWVHDFHLFLLPKLLKNLNSKVKVGFFLHIPFPSSEVFRQLPVRESVLDGLLYSDLIGFHDYSYLRHFCSAVHNVLGVESSLLSIQYHQKTTQLGVFPVSIDTNNFVKKAQVVKTQSILKSYKTHLKSQKLILGVDRLDYTKGIELKLKAYRMLLKKYPSLQGQVKLLQIAVPSRTTVPEYINLKSEVDQLVGEINGELGRPNYVPIEYIFNSVDIYELLALYQLADVLFITSKRDGMNLVCLEYLAAQPQSNPGVIVLSEFAGAINTLSYALSVNPWDLSQSCLRLYQAITMDKEERLQRHKPMIDFLKQYTATHWASTFMKSLGQGHSLEKGLQARQIKGLQDVKPLKKHLQDKKVILLADFDGTLAPICQNPEDACIQKPLLQTLKKVTKLKKCELIVVSGRPSEFLREQLDELKVSWAAEHGAKFYNHKQNKLDRLIRSSKKNWYTQAESIMKDYAVRTPGSFIEKKDYSLVFHYRNSPDQFADFQARKLYSELDEGLANLPATVLAIKNLEQQTLNQPINLSLLINAILSIRFFWANFNR